jgi:hypothetical protein
MARTGNRIAGYADGGSMARLDALARHGDADLAALYWWRRDNAGEERDSSSSLAQRVAVLAERAAPAAAPIVGLPGNRLRAKAQARRAPVETRAQAAKAVAVDPDVLAAIRHERRYAMMSVVTGLLATVAPAAVAFYAAAIHQMVALGFAMAGMFAGSFALYHALRWLMLMRSSAPPTLPV